MRVLVVEDTPDIAKAVCLFVELCGHESCLASDGKTAIATAVEQQPDLILLDIGLPDIDGYTVARRLRGEANLARLKIVAMSAFDPDEAQLQSSGIDEFHVKPVDMTTMRSFLSGEVGSARAN